MIASKPLIHAGATSSSATAIPIVQGVLVGEREPIDAVPLIDVHTATVLGHAGAFSVMQRPSLSEACCPACERSNVYDIYDGNSGQHLFFAKERSQCCARVLCAPRHSLTVEFKLSTSLPPQMIFGVDIDTLPTVMTMERLGCPSKPCLGCCVLLPICRDGMYMHAGPAPRDDLKGPTVSSSACIGFATQPNFGGGLTPTLNVMERARSGASTDNAWNALAKVEGPMCFGGCHELCFTSTFHVSSLSLFQLNQKVAMGDMATIRKLKPHDLSGMLREAVTDADVYTMELNPSARLAPQQKATLLGTLLLTDYMFFERDTPACTGNGCNLCQVYCCGCSIPCSCVTKSSSSAAGGGAGFRADQ